MAASSVRSPIAALAAGELAGYFEHLALRVEQAAQSVSAEDLWRRPFPFGNSIGHLVLHLTGNLNHYIGAQIAGTGYVRDRDREFTETDRPETAELLRRFHQAVGLVVRTLQDIDDAGFQAPVEHNAPIKSRLGMFLVCASHMNNHIGQMSYLSAALKPGTEQEPRW
jgi:uncharacterized damage-inducible protein DinB